ncbi:MAG: SDR family NAD(P)-dependent oxidoreductase, partial [Streptomycetaceae bacterium]|nr:SDR family NAD(P)-dependent oxidoreductase [Streptomycetaceae bacterium]
MAGRICVVTGGTRGIGAATVDALAETGATVVLTGRDEA